MAPLPFAFPLIGLVFDIPVEPGDTGWREFPTEQDFVTGHPMFLAGREGMLLVDAAGHSWQVTSVRVVGPVGAWPERLWRRFRGKPRVRLEQTFVERPPVAFGDLKNALYGQLRRHRAGLVIDGHHYARHERLMIKQAQTLRDIVPTAEERALANAPTRQPHAFEQALGDGRLDRGGLALFVLGAAAVAGGMAIIGRGVDNFPLVFGGFLLFAAAIISALARRLRDLDHNPHQLWLIFVWTMPLALLHDASKHNAAFLEVLGWVWWAPILAAVVWLATWPGSPGKNRFGPAPRG